jgi:hypothetical protein
MLIPTHGEAQIQMLLRGIFARWRSVYPRLIDATAGAKKSLERICRHVRVNPSPETTAECIRVLMLQRAA